MKKILCILLSLVPLLCFAQGRGIALLDKAAGKRVTFDYVYSLDQGKGMSEVTRGSVTAQGNCFVVSGLGLKSYSDGTVLWMVDENAKEVVIDAVVNDDVFTNPALMISSYRNFMDQIKVNREGSDSLDLTITLDDNTKVRFVLSSVRFADHSSLSEFTFQTSALPSSYVVTDLR